MSSVCLVHSEFGMLRVVVGTDAVCLGQEGSPRVYHGIRVKSMSTNTHIIYVGANDEVGSNGYELKADASVFIPVDTLEKVWAIAAAAGQVVCITYA